MGQLIAIIQARMGSRRLPGKVLREVGGEPLLGHMLSRVAKARSLDGYGVATTDRESDDPVAAFCEERGVPCYRGSEKDVLKRYVGAAEHFGAEAIVRLTADCPLIDPLILDQVATYFQAHDFDYVSNTQDRSYPRGMDVEVFSRAALEQAAEEAVDPYDREHVTSYLYNKQGRFRVGRLEMRLTVDHEADLELIGRLLGKLEGRDYRLADIVSLLQTHPEWVSINGHLIQEEG
ncbi:MAG: NTP transferase domain-containing protein [Parachlamydiales bacterium]